MRVKVRVRASAKENKIEKVGDELKISTKEPARDGRANEAVLKLLADYFGVVRARLKLRRGAGSPQKIIEIL